MFTVIDRMVVASGPVLTCCAPGRCCRISRSTPSPNWSTSHFAWEKNRQAAWNDTVWAIRAPASMPTTVRRPVVATIPDARIVNIVNVPRRRKTPRNGSSNTDHETGKTMHGS